MRPATGPALKSGTEFVMPTDLPQNGVQPELREQPRVSLRQSRYQIARRRQDRFDRLGRDYIPILAAVAILLSLVVIGGIFYTYSGDREPPGIGSLTADNSHSHRR
jgi:hypothetical protein